MRTRRRPGWWVALGVGLLGSVFVPAARLEAREAVELVERTEVGRRTRLDATLEAQGHFLPGEGTDEQPVEPLELSVETRIEAIDQVLRIDASGLADRLQRQVLAGEVRISGQEPIRPLTIALRPEVSRLILDRPTEGELIIASPAGPLTRPELDLLRLPADPLELPLALPDMPVSPGDRWPVPDALARALSGYDSLETQTIEATLKALDDDSAEITLSGRVEGAVLGARGRLDLDGSIVFDRRLGRIASASIQRAERREPGLVEAGLEFQSKLIVERADVPAGDEEEAVVIKVPDHLPDSWLMIRYESPDGHYWLDHDRSWHVFSEDDRQVVLRGVESGQVVAQVNLVIGPMVEPGAHPKPDRFRSDVREALGDRVDRVIDAGRLSAPAGEFRYRLAIGGRQGDEPIVWYYYLISDASGRQLVVIFTMRESEVEWLGRRDQRIIESLRWFPASEDGEAASGR